MFYDIIMDMIMNKLLLYHVVGVESYFTKMENNIIYMYKGSLQVFYWEKGSHESLDVLSPNFNAEIFKMRQYFPNILKCDTSSDDMKEKIHHWLDFFELIRKQYITIPS